MRDASVTEDNKALSSRNDPPEERQLPQLVMRRDNLDDLPEIALPRGYELRHYEPGDEAHWEYIVEHAFGWKRDFQTQMAGHFYFHPERVWFILYDGVPVATASAWQEPEWEADCGYLHMVGVHPGHSGKGLGLAVSVAALRRMQADGKRRAVLETDDFRIPAIKTYLKLIFKPDIRHDNHPGRWQRLYELLNIPFEEKG